MKHFNKIKVEKIYLRGPSDYMVDVTSAIKGLNSFASVTATVSELNTMDGVTADKSELNIMDGVTATTSELNLLASLTATASELNILDGVTATVSELNIMDGVTATKAELTNAIDVSGRTQTIAASGAQAVTAGKQIVELNHASQISATIANAANHQGIFIVKQRAPAGDAAHNLVLTAGTFDGTNNTATMNAVNDALCVYFDSNGNGTIIENVGSVALS